MTLLKLTQRIDNANIANIHDTLTLPYELRIRGRLKAVTDNGQEVGLFLDRGPVLRHGALLQADSGEIIQVFAADEPVATAYIGKGLPLARLCYHLGNRHVSLALGRDDVCNINHENTDNIQNTEGGRYWVRFPPDHVLEELASLLGATVVHHAAPFDPESGAYAQAGREQAHSYEHNQEHSQEQPHNHDHDHSHNYEHQHEHSQSHVDTSINTQVNTHNSDANHKTNALSDPYADE